MNLQQFQQQSKRTCPSLGDKLDLAHMVLGIFSEFEEYMNATDEVNKSEECSDMMWYIGNYCSFRGLNLESLWGNKEYNGNSFVLNVSVLQDYIKKNVAYNREINRLKEFDVLTGLLFNISKMYGNINVEQSLENNINKLKIRFPDKFSEENAINRNLEKERQELEKNI
jgi:hypothetical protein